MRVNIELQGLSEIRELLSGIKNGFPRAMVRSVNKTAVGARSDAAKEVAKEFNLPQKYIKRDFSIKKANFHDLAAHIIAKGKPQPLARFTRTRQTAKGVSVQVKKSRPRQVLRHAFIIGRTYRAGTPDETTWTGVVWRVGKNRYPLKLLYTSRVPDILSNREVMEPILAKAGERLIKNAGHEVEFLLQNKVVTIGLEETEVIEDIVGSIVGEVGGMDVWHY